MVTLSTCVAIVTLSTCVAMVTFSTCIASLCLSQFKFQICYSLKRDFDFDSEHAWCLLDRHCSPGRCRSRDGEEK